MVGQISVLKEPMFLKRVYYHLKGVAMLMMFSLKTLCGNSSQFPHIVYLNVRVEET